MAYPCAILPPPRPVPVLVVLVRTIGNRQAPFLISGRPSAVQSAGSGMKFATGHEYEIRGRVAVTPKLPAVPVVAESVTLVTPRMNLPAAAAGIRPLSGIINDAGRVAAKDTVSDPVVPSL